MEQKIKQLRVQLDGLTQLTKSLDPQNAGHATRTREISLAITSLELSKMWLGKVLKELGTTNPYPESKNPTNEKIELTADTNKESTFPVKYNTEKKEVRGLSHIQKVKWLRAEIEKVENELFELMDQIEVNFPKRCRLDNHSTNSYNYCIEAGMWLGMELGRIRDNENKTN